MSGQKDREKRREERIAAESKAASGDRRTRLLQLSAGGVFLAIIVVVVVIIVAGSGGSSGGEASNLVEKARGRKAAHRDPAERHRPRQNERAGEALRVRRPAVPGLQRLFRRNPAGTHRKPGEKRRSQHHLPQLHHHRPADSIPAGEAALAAGAQGKGWTFIETWYRNQGEENSGYVTEEFIESMAKYVGIPDIAKFKKEWKCGKYKKQVEEHDRPGGKVRLPGDAVVRGRRPALQRPRTARHAADDRSDRRSDRKSRLASARLVGSGDPSGACARVAATASPAPS